MYLFINNSKYYSTYKTNTLQYINYYHLTLWTFKMYLFYYTSNLNIRSNSNLISIYMMDLYNNTHLKINNDLSNVNNEFIPKVIYMCHKELSYIEKYSINWKILNPEYEVKLYDDNLCRDFFIKEYNNRVFLEIFDFIKDGPIKADFWRLCVIYKYGGIYIDADIEPIIPLKEYVNDNDYFVTCISYNFGKNNKIFQFNPHFIISNKNNFFVKKAIQRYIIAYRNNKNNYSYWGWSICTFFQMNELELEEKKSQIKMYENKKYKFLLEFDGNTNVYNNKVVFKSRYSNYKNHNFEES